MDPRQQCGMRDYGYSEPETQGYKDGGLLDDHGPYYLPGRRGAYGVESMVSSFGHVYDGFHIRKRSSGEEATRFQSGLGASPLLKPYFATSPETSTKDYAYTGTKLQRVANPFDWVYDQGIQRRSQDCGIPDVTQSGTETSLRSRQRYSDPLPYGSNMKRRPIGPSDHMSLSFDYASNPPYPASSTTSANCRDRQRMYGNMDYQPEQRLIGPFTDWWLQSAANHWPIEDMSPPSRQIFTQEMRRNVPNHKGLDMWSPEQSKSGLCFRRPPSVNASDKSVTVHANKDGRNKGPTRKRNRKARVVKPRKPRTLTDEGKAHAKAVRELPGGACKDCKRKKTKCTHRLPQDMPTDSQDKLTPSTPWTEPLTPDHGHGYHDPMFWRSSQEDDFGYGDMDSYSS